MLKPESKNVLLTKFAQRLDTILALEKKLVKLYAKMVSVAHLPELAKCLSPVSTDIEKHLERIKLIKQALPKSKIEAGADKISVPAQKFSTSGLKQDLEIIETVLTYQHQKLAVYEYLYPLSTYLETDMIGELLKQTITDNRNTNIWLLQLMQNIIVPDLAD